MSTRTVGWLLVGVQVLVYVILALLPLRPPTLASAAIAAPFAVLGGMLAVASFRTLGSALTPTPVPIPAAGLRIHGPYSRLRHPIYTAVLCITYAAVIAMGTWWSVGWTVVITIFFWVKSRWEDRLLEQEYGDTWRQWAAKTGALIPRRRRSAP